MKKILSIFISVVFLSSALGITINTHYCGNKLRSITLLEKECCCGTENGTNDGCCKNEIKYVKITDDYSPASQLHVSKVEISSFSHWVCLISSTHPFSSPILFPEHAPPPKVPDIVIAFRSLLI